MRDGYATGVKVQGRREGMTVLWGALANRLGYSSMLVLLRIVLFPANISLKDLSNFFVPPPPPLPSPSSF